MHYSTLYLIFVTKALRYVVINYLWKSS